MSKKADLADGLQICRCNAAKCGCGTIFVDLIIGRRTVTMPMDATRAEEIAATLLKGAAQVRRAKGETRGATH